MVSNSYQMYKVCLKKCYFWCTLIKPD